MKKSIHYPLVLAVIAALCVAGIDIVYSNVAEKIRIADTKKALNAACCIFGCAAEEIEPRTAQYNDETITWFACPAGYAVVVGAQGYDGEVKVMVGWDKSLEKIMGIYVLSHTETPRLGGNVDLINSANTWANILKGTMVDESDKRPDFQEQFRGLALAEAKLKKDGGEVDSITSATITSRAVVNAVQKSHSVLKAILEKQGK